MTVPPAPRGTAGPFVARGVELARLRDEVARARREPDRPAGMIVVGPAGVGKTRLVGRLGSQDPTDTIRILATRATAMVPFGAIAQIGTDLTPECFEDPVAWYSAVTAAVAAHGDERPLVIVDDAHLLDAGSAGLVLHLAVQAAAIVVATVRRGEPCPEPITALWRDDLARRLDLQPFSTGEVAEQVTALLGGPVGSHTVELFADSCGGNPLFIEELLHSALEDGTLEVVDGLWQWSGSISGTPRLVDAVEARTGRLDPQQRMAVATIALGEPLAVRVAESLIGLERLAEVERLGLVTTWATPTGTMCGCTHPLYGEVALAEVGYFERRRLSGELADWLAKIGDDCDDDRLRVTRHRLEAGRDVPVAELADAAIAAVDAFDLDLGKRLAEAALAKGPQARAMLALARSLVGTGDAVAAEKVLAEAEGEVFPCGSPALLERYVDTRFNATYMQLGDGEATLAWLERFAAAADDAGLDEPDVTAVHDLAVAYRARILVHEGDLCAVLREAGPVRARPDAPPLARLHALQTTGEALAYQGLTRAARHIHDDLRALAATGRREVVIGAMWANMQEVLCLSQEGRLVEAAAIVEPAVRALRTDDQEARGLVNVVLGAVRIGQGKPVSAKRPLLDAIEAYRDFDAGGGGAWAFALLAQAEAMLGDGAAAEEARHRSRARHRGATGLRGELDFALADAGVAIAGGRVTEATDILLDAADGFDEAAMFRVRALHLAVTLGADPHPIVGRLTELAAATECELSGICAAYVRALVSGDGPALERVAEQFAELGMMLRAAEAAASAVGVYRFDGVRSGVRRASARARVLSEACEGASTPLLGALQEPVGLSKREREVAGLVARGLSNREIADALSLSVRTVESHVYQVFAKLGVSQRTDVAGVLASGS